MYKKKQNWKSKKGSIVWCIKDQSFTYEEEWNLKLQPLSDSGSAENGQSQSCGDHQEPWRLRPVPPREAKTAAKIWGRRLRLLRRFQSLGHPISRSTDSRRRNKVQLFSLYSWIVLRRDRFEELRLRIYPGSSKCCNSTLHSLFLAFSHLLLPE